MDKTPIKAAGQERETGWEMLRRGGQTAWRRGWIISAALIAVLIVSLYVVFQSSPGKHGATAGGSGFRHVAGQPGAGSAAPPFTLTSGAGGQVSLTDFRGKNVLLYFQEGLSCQPCWDQIKDLEHNQAALKTAGVDAVLSITTDPANLIGQKVSDERLTTPVLSDSNLQVSQAYNANHYGMMGQMRDGHSFILVGPEGTIHWRADYGGKPNYTMYVPTAKILTDLKAERTA